LRNAEYKVLSEEPEQTIKGRTKNK